MLFKLGIIMSVFLFLFQRIRDLEDKIELQKRQLKEIEEKVNLCMCTNRGFFPIKKIGFLCCSDVNST